MKPNLTIHVGYPKTGTTYLQDLVFPNIKNVNLVTRGMKKNWLDLKVYDDKINIFSDECLVGNYYKPNNGRMTTESGFKIADRIKAIFPYAKILVGLRDKSGLKRALYSNYLQDGGVLSFDDWCKYILDFGILEYDFYIKHLKNNFDSVHVYYLETLKEGSKEFVKGICNFIGCEVPEYDDQIVYKSYSVNQMRLAKWINRFWYSPVNTKGKLPWFGRFNPTFIVREIFKNL